MRGAVMHAPGDVEVVEPPDPMLLAPTDAVIPPGRDLHLRVGPVASAGVEEVADPSPMGHEHVGVVKQIGDEIRKIKVGDFVVGSFFASDNTCEICRAGYQSRCIRAHLMGSEGTQAELARVPRADGTLVATQRNA